MLFGTQQNKPRGLFGGFAPGPATMQANPMQDIGAGMQSLTQPSPIAQMQANMPQPTQKPGINWLGVLADALAGANGQEGPYSAMMAQRRQQEFAQRQADMARQNDWNDWQRKEEWKREHPDPINNDTVNDYDFILKMQGPEAANQYLQGRYDPIVNIPLGDGRTYIGPRSGAPSAIGAQTSGQAPARPVGKLTLIGDGSGNATGGFLQP